VCDLETSRMGAPYIYIYDISRLRVKSYTVERKNPVISAIDNHRNRNFSSSLLSTTVLQAVCARRSTFGDFWLSPLITPSAVTF